MIRDQLETFSLALAGRTFHLPTILNYARFWLIDIKSKVEISSAPQKDWLKVDNASGLGFLFIRIDGTNSVFGSTPPPVNDDFRFIYDKAGSRAGSCDCLIIDESKWHFMEFKTNSSSEELEQIQMNRVKAEMQIARTIDFFKTSIPEININCKAVIVVPKYFGYPRFRSEKSRAVKFKLKWKVSLEEISISDKYNINT